jgi:hypothetical protein
MRKDAFDNKSLQPSENKDVFTAPVTEPEKKEENQEEQEDTQTLDKGFTTPSETPIHNVDKSILPIIEGDPDPGNPVLSNPGLLPQASMNEEQLTQVAQQDEEPAQQAPSVHTGDRVTYITQNGVERHAVVSDAPTGEDSAPTLHVFLNPEDTEYADHGPVAALRNILFHHSGTKRGSWVKR